MPQVPGAAGPTRTAPSIGSRSLGLTYGNLLTLPPRSSFPSRWPFSAAWGHRWHGSKTAFPLGQPGRCPGTKQRVRKRFHPCRSLTSLTKHSMFLAPGTRLRMPPFPGKGIDDFCSIFPSLCSSPAPGYCFTTEPLARVFSPVSHTAGTI